MKRTFLSLMFLMAFIACFAQSETGEKETVYIDYFTKSSDVNSSDVETLRNKIIEGITATQRVTVIDVASNEILKAEALRRQETSAMGDATARKEEMSTLGAGSLIQGHVTSLVTTKGKDDDGKVFYESIVKFTIKIVDASTGTLKTTESFENNGKSQNKEKSIVKCLDISSYNMETLVEKNFKLEGVIIAVKDIKGKKGKEKAETVYINIGSARGVKEGQPFNVYECVDIAGELSYEEIGRVTVSEIMSPNRSVCKVKKGGDRIQKFLKDNAENGGDAKLVIKSDGTNLGEDFVNIFKF